MSEDFSDIIKNVKNMVDNGNIPDNIKDILSSLSSDNNSNNSSNNNSKIDMDTIIKIKTIIDNVNNSNDPRANLLYSLKPYLRKTRKDKIDQYVNFLNITKIANLMNNENKENNGND